MGGSSSQIITPLPRGKTVIITGGNSGIGYETAKTIAMMGAKVIIAVRTEDRGIEAIKRMNEDFEAAKMAEKPGIIYDDELDVSYMVCDLSSIKSTLQFIEKFKAKKLNLHVLICNACTYALQEVRTEDDFDVVYQVNYLSHFLMVSHLLPIMEKSGDDCRIVLLSSEVHREMKFDATYASGKPLQDYDGYTSYALTKLFQIMYMYSLDRVLEKSTRTVDVLAVHPGKLDATVYRKDPRASQGFNCRICCMDCCGRMKSFKEGSGTTVYAALSPTLKGTSRGYYMHPKDGPKWPSLVARKTELQNHLWTSTIENLRQYFTEEVLQTLGETEQEANK